MRFGLVFRHFTLQSQNFFLLSLHNAVTLEALFYDHLNTLLNAIKVFQHDEPGNVIIRLVNCLVKHSGGAFGTTVLLRDFFVDFCMTWCDRAFGWGGLKRFAGV